MADSAESIVAGGDNLAVSSSMSSAAIPSDRQQRARSRSTRRSSSGQSARTAGANSAVAPGPAPVAHRATNATGDVTDTSLHVLLQQADDLRYPAHIVGQDRGRALLPTQAYHGSGYVPHLAQAAQHPHTSLLPHAHNHHLRGVDEEADQEGKSWHNYSPTLAPSSLRESFEEDPRQAHQQYKEEHYPMLPKRSYDFAASPPGAAAVAYPSNKGNGPLAVPLISNIKNEWQRSASHARRKSETVDSDWDRPHPGALLRRLFRRRTFAFLVLTISTIWMLFHYLGSSYNERQRLRASLSSRLNQEKGYFGVNQRVGFMNMQQVTEIERWKVPGSGEHKHGISADDRRLIIVGDIHGCFDELRTLMEKVRFDAAKDHLVTAGDMISRGPDSPSVLSYLIERNASCVRGNHEDRVLLGRRDVDNPSHRKTTYGEDGSVSHQSLKKGAASDLDLARSLSEAHIAYLKTCPVILDLGEIPGMGFTSVVHAGLVPAVPLIKQDPSAVMSMRSIDLRSHVPSKNPAPKPNSLVASKDRDQMGRSYIVPWSNLWNAYQDMIHKKARSTVIYGHDAKRGIVKEDWSWGLDGNCVRGGKLAAMVVSTRKKAVHKEIVTVDCADHSLSAKKEAALGDS